MTEEAEYPTQIESKAGSLALVESFTIQGLYGYRTVSINSPYAATILIARNGAGKTTLIGALHAFLKGQFSRLKELDFESITCKLRTHDEQILITHDDILEYLDISPEGEIAKYARRLEIEPSILFHFLFEEYPELLNDYISRSDNKVYSAIERLHGYRSEETRAACQKLIDSSEVKNKRLFSIQKLIFERMRDIDVIYLPTYRRIELPLASESREVGVRRRKASVFPTMRNSVLAGDIQFGLSDISDRLAEINQSILVDSNLGYRKISADIINELIATDLDKISQGNIEVPSGDELNLFFSRLRDASRRSPYIDNVSLPNIDRVYEASSQITETAKFLKYFLGKLTTVIKATQDIEVGVQDFIDNCNRYLSSQDPTTLLPGDSGGFPKRASADDKILRLNRRNLTVHAESVIGGRKISLDSLSSGEKQMVSLFAKLFLYPKEKIVLIDEPELSLSLGWQRQILVDVLLAPLCAQIIAITHSPFVFDNELEPFAKSLVVGVNLASLPPSADEDDEV